MSLVAESGEQRKKIHPQKFMMWMAMGSVSMMFAGLTSAYIVRESQGNWRYYNLPSVFIYSTVAIVISSITMILAVKAFKARQMSRYKAMVGATLLLGLLFGAMQFAGFYNLAHQLQQIRINGEVLKEASVVKVSGNPSESFLYIIAGLHLAHVAGGIIALAVLYFKAFRKRVKVYNATGLEIIASYWHFVDVLWLYLFVFFLANQ